MFGSILVILKIFTNIQNIKNCKKQWYFWPLYGLTRKKLLEKLCGGETDQNLDQGHDFLLILDEN